MSSGIVNGLRDLIAFPLVLGGMLIVALGQWIGSERTRKAMDDALHKTYWESLK